MIGVLLAQKGDMYLTCTGKDYIPSNWKAFDIGGLRSIDSYTTLGGEFRYTFLIYHFPS